MTPLEAVLAYFLFALIALAALLAYGRWRWGKR